MLSPHDNYPGCQAFGSSVAKLSSTPIGNDAVTSIRVRPGYMALLYQHDNYGGACEAFAAADANLTDNTIGNDSASSFIIREVGDACTPLYVAAVEAVSGREASTACPHGYVKRSQDLNQGTLNHQLYVFLCVGYHTEITLALRELEAHVVEGDLSAMNPLCQWRGGTVITTDLNDGALAEEAVYLCYKRSGSAAPIKDVWFWVTDTNPEPAPFTGSGNPLVDKQANVNQGCRDAMGARQGITSVTGDIDDLNESARGAYLFLCIGRGE